MSLGRRRESSAEVKMKDQYVCQEQLRVMDLQGLRVNGERLGQEGVGPKLL